MFGTVLGLITSYLDIKGVYLLCIGQYKAYVTNSFEESALPPGILRSIDDNALNLKSIPLREDLEEAVIYHICYTVKVTAQ